VNVFSNYKQMCIDKALGFQKCDSNKNKKLKISICSDWGRCPGGRCPGAKISLPGCIVVINISYFSIKNVFFNIF